MYFILLLLSDEFGFYWNDMMIIIITAWFAFFSCVVIFIPLICIYF